MHIKRLRLRNFKGFVDFDQSLNARFTLIVGNNGVGKSSVLDALSVAFGSFLLGIPSATPRHIHQSEVREVERDFDGVLDFVKAFPVTVEAEGELLHPVTRESKSLHWKRELGGEKGRNTIKDARALFSVAEEAYKAVVAGADATLPLLSYYGTGRLWVEPKNLKRKARPSRFDAYRNSHEPRVSSVDLLDWLGNERLRELETDRPSPLLSAWRSAVEACFDAEVKLSFSPSRRRLEVYFQSSDRTVAYENLSHGQRNILSMIGDIAFKAIILNPHLKENAVKEVQGVILIDELDLHLHPRWQRIIVPALLRAFPRLQFVATTHSPFIIQSLSEGVLLDLDEMEVDDRVYNMPLQDIVEDVQKVETSDRSALYVQKVLSAEDYLAQLEILTTLTDPGQIERSEAELDKMEKQFQDPALAAIMRVERLSKLKKK
jgi:predicted ATP-binding protein involved in virulence